MYRIKKSAIVRAMQDSPNHTFTVYEHPDGYTLTLDDKACLETERGEVRKFKKLDVAASMVKELGVDRFTVAFKPAGI
jgi:hypothetical protein